MTMFRIRRFIPFLFIVGGACAPSGNSEMRDLSELRTLAVRTLEAGSGSRVSLADVISVQPLAGDSLLLIDDHKPFFRLFVADSLAAAFGAKGEGPGELRQPGTLAMQGDTVVITDNQPPETVRFLLSSRKEVDRSGRPHGIMDIFPGCGGVAAVVQLLRPQIGGDQPDRGTQNYGVAMFVDGKWTMPHRDFPGMHFVPRGKGRIADEREGIVGLYNDFFSRIEFVDCQTGERTHTVAVPYPEDWSIPPRRRGVFWLGRDFVVLFSGATRALGDTTYIARWGPDALEVQVRRVPGRLWLHWANSTALWFVDGTLAPEPFMVTPDDFDAWLGRE